MATFYILYFALLCYLPRLSIKLLSESQCDNEIQGRSTTGNPMCRVAAHYLTHVMPRNFWTLLYLGNLSHTVLVLAQYGVNSENQLLMHLSVALLVESEEYLGELLQELHRKRQNVQTRE